MNDRLMVPFPITDKETYIELFLRNTRGIQCYSINNEVIHVMKDENVESFKKKYENHNLKYIDPVSLF